MNADVDAYLRTHVPGTTREPEFLVCRDHRTVWLVRWPNGSVKWESSASLRARCIAISRAPVVGDVE